MRVGAWTLAAVIVGAVVAQLLLQDRGYVLVNFLDYSVEMSVPALLVLLCAGYLAVRLALAIWRAPRKLGSSVADARTRRAGSKLTRGLIHMAEGDWAKGERLLTQSVKGSESPLINYLLAARAAQRQGLDDRRDDWLRRAYEEMPEAEAAILLTQAELQLEHEEYEQALATLSRVEESHPDHPLALELLIRTHGALADWDRVLALLPKLKGAAELGDVAAAALAHYIARKDIAADDLEALWRKLPAPLRKRPSLIAIHAEGLSRLGRADAGEKALRAALRTRWDEALVRAYGKIVSSQPSRQLKRAEQWLKTHPEDAALLLSAARLCMAVELWGKARSYLESSLALLPEPAAYALYGQLLKALGEEDEAALAFRSGLALVAPGGADLPALVAPQKTAAAPVEDAAAVSAAASGASRATR